MWNSACEKIKLPHVSSHYARWLGHHKEYEEALDVIQRVIEGEYKLLCLYILCTLNYSYRGR